MSKIAVGNGPLRLVTGDFNGDGILDVATSSEIANTVSVLLGKGDGTFKSALTYPAGGQPFSIAVGDFNADGYLDLVVTNVCPGYPTCSGATVSVLLGNGNGTFQPQVQYATGKGPDAVSLGDFNGDGKLDLAIVSDTDSAVCIFLGIADGTFQPYVEYPAGAGADGVTTGDFNGDGALDLAVTTNASGTDQEPVSILLGNGDGSFREPTFYTTAVGYLGTIQTADLNGDGKLDLIATGLGYGSESGGVSVLVGNADGTFQTHVDYLLNTAVDSVAVGDFNGDGISDLGATHINPSG
jgi:FG-GAP-like repeat